MKTRSQEIAFPFSRLTNLTVWRSFAVCLLAAIFAFQGYVTQSHIHFSPPRGISGSPSDYGVARSSGSIAGDLGTQQKRDRYPTNDDPSNCPICQQIALAGHCLTAGTDCLVPLSQIALGVLIDADGLVLISGVSHTWRGRGPPSI